MGKQTTGLSMRWFIFYIYMYICIYIYVCMYVCTYIYINYIHTSQSDTSEFDILNSAALFFHPLPCKFRFTCSQVCFSPGACDLALDSAGRYDCGDISSGLTFRSARRLFTWTRTPLTFWRKTILSWARGVAGRTSDCHCYEPVMERQRYNDQWICCKCDGFCSNWSGRGGCLRVPDPVRQIYLEALWSLAPHQPRRDRCSLHQSSRKPDSRGCIWRDHSVPGWCKIVDVTVANMHLIHKYKPWTRCQGHRVIWKLKQRIWKL